MTWKNIIKANTWFIKTDEFAGALPDELVNQLGNDPTEKLAGAYKNGLLINLKTNTHYTIENRQIVDIAQYGNIEQ